MVHMTGVKKRWPKPELVAPGADGDAARPGARFASEEIEPMRRRPLTMLTALAVATLVVAGCDEALVEAQAPPKAAGKPVPSAPPHLAPPQLETVHLLLDSITMPGPPQGQPALPLALPGMGIG